jgi:hypothetical protein
MAKWFTVTQAFLGGTTMAKKRILPDLSLGFVPGESYLSILCKSCQKAVPISIVDEPECWAFRGLITVRCPFCEAIDRYSFRDTKVLALEEKLPAR